MTAPSSPPGPDPQPLTSRLARRIDVGLVLILLLATALRLLYLDHPFAEAHRWRSVTNADITRNFFLRSLNVLYPQVSWGGPEGYVGMEFPLLQWTTAVLYRLVGEREVLCRLVSIVFSLGAVAAIYALGRRLFGRAEGRAAAFLLAVSPSVVFFGRSFISDTPMLLFGVLGVLGFVTYLRDGSRAAAILGAAGLALAGLVKLPAVVVCAPIGWAAWKARRWGCLRDPWLLGGITAALLLVVAWYWHADRIYHMTGLTQAILHPSNDYAPAIATSMRQPVRVFHWGAFQLLLDPAFYTRMLDWTWHLHLTPVGFALVLVALTTMTHVPGYGVASAWLVTVVASMLFTAEGNFHHEFHQLPLMPPAALLFGLVAAPLFDGPALRERFRGWWGPPVAAVLVVTLGLLSFHYSGVVRQLYRPKALDMGPIAVGHALRGAVPADQLLVTVEYQQYGINSPILLYHAQRRGWSFDMRSISPHVIERLRSRFGARFFVTTLWPQLERQQPEVAEYLRQKPRVDLGTMPRSTALFRLD